MALREAETPEGSCATIINNTLPLEIFIEQQGPSADDAGSTVQCSDCAYHQCPYAEVLDAESEARDQRRQQGEDWDDEFGGAWGGEDWY
jgi:hypothetical protein